MSDGTGFFDLWAPYWSYCEDNFLDVESLERVLVHLRSRVLIVGAGQGLLVEALRKKGLGADGVDASARMVHYAAKRRGIELFQANANDMPFPQDSYATSIVATGVIDYMGDLEQIKATVREVERVTDDQGEIFIAFYKFFPGSERFMRTMGLISDDSKWYCKRTYEFMSLRPAECVAEFKKNAGARAGRDTSLFADADQESGLQKKESDRAKKWKAGWAKIRNEIPDLHEWIQRSPESYPYRDQKQILELFQCLDVPVKNLVVLDSCLIAQLAR